MDLVLFSKPGCHYCKVFQNFLAAANVDYEVVYVPERASGAYPKLMYKDRTVFVGLPSAKDLNEFLQSI